MKIISSLLPPDHGKLRIALATLIDGKTVFVGLGTGTVVDGRPECGPESMACFKHVIAHALQQWPNTEIRLVEMRGTARVGQRVREVLAAADHGDAVLFVCRTPQVYDAVFPHLQVQASPGLLERH